VWVINRRGGRSAVRRSGKVVASVRGKIAGVCSEAHARGQAMPKGQRRGNKEAKKPKKAPTPSPIDARRAVVPAEKAQPPRGPKK
jgi:hypothetical protein